MTEHPADRPAEQPQDPEAFDDPATLEDEDVELEEDPAYDPDDPELKRLKGG